MALTGNKGEWSELYAFFKLLSEGKLYCGDGYLNRYDDKFYPILEIFRDDKPDRNCYKINAAKNVILIAGESINLEISQSDFRDKANELLEFIKTISGSASNESIEAFMNRINCNSIKAVSSDKADIRIVIHNLSTGSKPELGYSIKSKVGADSTLINANKDGTNFEYIISNFPKDCIDEFNSLKLFKDKFLLLEKHGAKIVFSNVTKKVLEGNLTMLDLGLSRIIAEELLMYYSGKCNTLADATNLVSDMDPLQINHISVQPMYSYKVKQFLLAFALGMTASTSWSGKFDANGGYIIVKEDGDVLCYHFFDRNDLEDYLYYNTRFETPSTTRHNFGKIYEEDDCLKIKLNLQVRFIK